MEDREVEGKSKRLIALDFEIAQKRQRLVELSEVLHPEFETQERVDERSKLTEEIEKLEIQQMTLEASLGLDSKE